MGGSSALDAVLRDLSFAGFDPYRRKRLKSKCDVSRSLDCVRELLAHGAIWNPDEKYDLNSLRRSLLECEPGVTIELLQVLRKHNACPAERVHKLLGTPRMKEHLKPETSALLRLGIHLSARPNLKQERNAGGLSYRWRKARRVFTSPDPDYHEKVDLLLIPCAPLARMNSPLDEWGPIQVRKRGSMAYRKDHATDSSPPSLSGPEQPRLMRSS